MMILTADPNTVRLLLFLAVFTSQMSAYVHHRLQRVREAGSNQAERKRRARLLALLAALFRVRQTPDRSQEPCLICCAVAACLVLVPAPGAQQHTGTGAASPAFECYSGCKLTSASVPVSCLAGCYSNLFA